MAAFTPVSRAVITPAELDTDGDGLADAWEIKHFNGLGHADGDPTDDPDGDGKDNLNECNAGTDPNDGTDCLAVVSSTFDPAAAIVTWSSVFAKRYNLSIGDDLVSWDNVEKTAGTVLDFRGTGETLTADFSNPADPCVTGAVTRRLWFGLTSIPADLDAHFAGLGAPTGTLWYPSLTTPTEDGEGYSSKLSGFIVPKTGGTYTFYASSRGPSRFRIYTDATPTAVLATCSVDDNLLVTEQDWVGATGSQISAAVPLVAGTKYLIEALHVHDSGLDHFAVAWKLGAGAIDVVPGDCLSPVEDFTSSNAAALFDGSAPKFARVVVHGALGGTDFDSDGDGINDATELELEDFDFDPHNPNGTGTGDDGARLAALLGFDPATDDEEVAAAATDNEAVEVLDPPLLPADIVDLGSLGSPTGPSSDKIRFRLSRSMGLHPLTVSYTLAGATESTEVSAAGGVDYTAAEGSGGPVADGSVTIPAFSSGVDIEVTVEKDSTHEYPETISCTVVPVASSYATAPGAALAKAEIVDMPGNVNILFVGAYEEDFKAVPGSSAVNGTVSGYLKGDKRTFILRNDNFGNLTSPQSDTHFHKILLSGVTEIGGPPIHDILSAPPEEEVILGHYLTYHWDLTEQNPVNPTPGPGGPSRQVVIDSLFNQNGQTQLYVNLHTDDNSAGEAMARLLPATGSFTEPDAPADPPDPGEPGFELLAGAALEADIVRFLNQATFGAAWEDVQAIKAAIETERTTGGNPNYHQVEEFEKWIDNQAKMDQTFILDYNLALDALEFNLRGIWDPAEWNDWTSAATNPNNGDPVGTPDVEPVPTSWPYIDRSLTDGPAPGMPNTHPHFWGNQWYPVGRYPTDSDWIAWMDDNAASDGSKVVRSLGQRGPRHNNRIRAHWMMMANAKDQLRHKWGYAIQQILVVADTLTQIEDHHYAAANYQDMLNWYGLASDRDDSGTIEADEQTYFRNLLGFVNWSPVMGYWLSSIRNRAAYDSNGDSFIDVFPDENLAREDMQLFTIGLFNLWPDGSLQLQTGNDPNTPPGASATYDNDDIQQFARILTGQNISRQTLDGRSPTSGSAFIMNGWTVPPATGPTGFREGPYGWGIITTPGVFQDKGQVFDTINNNDTGVAPDISDTGDGDDGIYYNTSFTSTSNGNQFMGHEWNYPMRMFGKSGTSIYHDLGVKTIAGGRVIDNTGLLVPEATNFTDASIIAMGIKDIEDAMNWFGGKVDGNPAPDFTGAAGDSLSSNQSTPAFITRRLIQRMVTSNPSSAYLYRVSKAFKDSEGCMLDVCKAVLLDYEARAAGNIDATYGMKKSPLEAYIQVLRSFEAHSLLPVTDDPALRPFADAPYNGAWPTVAGGFDPGNYLLGQTDPHESIFATAYGYPGTQADNFRFNCIYQYPLTNANLSMSPFHQETVFNYYLPDYTRGVVQSAALVAPELQLATETEVVNNHNYFWTITWQWDTFPRDARNDGQAVSDLGASSQNQRYAFGQANTAGDWDNHDNVRINFDTWAEFIFAQPPFVAGNIPAAGGPTSESLEAEAVLDFIDHRLTGGALKAKYPYDTSNDDSNPAVDSTANPHEPTSGDSINNNDVDARNPREWIIHAIVDGFNDGTAYASDADKNNRVNIFRTALYLYSQTPEYLVKK